MTAEPHPAHANLSRRRMLGLGAAGALAGTAAWTGGTIPAVAGTTYNMFRGAGSQSNDSNFSNSPELVTYSATGVRGGLWVHNSDLETVENGSYSDPFHRGNWGHNVRRVRVRSRRSFHQNYAVVVRGRTLWYDPRGGDVIDGVTRSRNGGLKVLIGHHSNDYNYAVILIRESGYITIQREYAHEYTTLENTYKPTPIEQYRSFKVTWYNDTIKVYDRRAEDGSNDVLLAQTADGAAPGVVNGVRYDDRPIGMYLDGAAVRMAYLRVWQA